MLHEERGEIGLREHDLCFLPVRWRFLPDDEDEFHHLAVRVWRVVILLQGAQVFRPQCLPEMPEKWNSTYSLHGFCEKP